MGCVVKFCQSVAGISMISKFHEFFHVIFGGFLPFYPTSVFRLTALCGPHIDFISSFSSSQRGLYETQTCQMLYCTPSFAEITAVVWRVFWIFFWKSKMPNVILYTLNESAPCRIVQMTLSVLNLKHEEITVDLFSGEHKTPEYLEVSFPCHFLSFSWVVELEFW